MSDLIISGSKTYSYSREGDRWVRINSDKNPHRTARNCEICGECFVLGDYGDTRRICPSCVEGLKALLKERKEDT